MAFILVVGLVLAVPALLVALDLLGARGELQEAEAAVRRARSKLASGDVAGAQAAFGDAKDAAGAAEGRLDAPIPRAVGSVPALGHTVRAARALSAAARAGAEAGSTVTTGLADLPAGLDALAPSKGRIPIGQVTALADPLERAAGLLREGQRQVEAAPRTWLVPQVADARDDALHLFDQATSSAEIARDLTVQLPALLGGEGRRRYFFGVASAAQAYGTGGFIGGFSIVTAEDGELRFADFRQSAGFPQIDAETLEPPNPDYQARYGPHNAGGFLSNINLTPDFPSAAVAIERLYEAVEGVTLDGTIVVDLHAVQELLRLTGPVTAPRIGTINAGNALRVLGNEAYGRFGDEIGNQGQRREILGDVAGEVFARFLAGDVEAESGASLRVLQRMTAGGHLLIHATDDDVQAALERTNLAGALLDPPGDFFTVVTNNFGLNKIDYFEERQIAYAADLRPGGSADATLEVTLTNDAPTSGQPRYVIGPALRRPDLNAGDSNPFLHTFGPSGATLTAVESSQTTPAVVEEQELGHPVWVTPLVIPSKQSRTITYDYRVPDAWEGTADEGLYRLTVQGQTTIRPTQLSLEVQLPDGVEIDRMTAGLQQDGRRVTYAGELGDVMTFEIEFSAPARNLGQRVWDFLSRPLFG